MAKRYYRRGHWVNVPSRRGTKSSGWVVAGVVAVVLYLLASGGGDDQDDRGPSSPASVAPAGTRTP
jgi:hypothetical protein